MVNVFDDTPAEKEEYVLDMLERGYSWPKIMKECHVSPNTISSIKKKYGGSTDNDSLQSGKTSKESQAFKLFQQGKSIIDVKIEIDIESNDLVEYYRRYQEIRLLSEFNRAYDLVKGKIQPFLRLFNLMNRLGMTPEQVAEQVSYGNNLPFLTSIHSSLSNEVYAMISQKHYLESNLNNMQDLMRQ